MSSPAPRHALPIMALALAAMLFALGLLLHLEDG